jgi:hypothetical protein
VRPRPTPQHSENDFLAINLRLQQYQPQSALAVLNLSSCPLNTGASIDDPRDEWLR